MKVIVLFSSLALAIAAGSAALSLQAVQPSPAAGYAEGIYADYARDAGGQIAFDLRVVAAGNLKALEGRPLSSIVGMPRYVIGTDQQRFNLRNARFAEDEAPLDAACACPVCANSGSWRPTSLFSRPSTASAWSSACPARIRYSGFAGSTASSLRRSATRTTRAHSSRSCSRSRAACSRVNWLAGAAPGFAPGDS